MAMTDDLIIQCEDLTKYFGSSAAVNGISLELRSGEILSLVGPSGSGKTTALRLLAGFEVPDGGTITLKGRRVAGPRTWVPPEKRQLGLVFQDYALFPHMTVARNVAFGLKGWDKQDRDRRVREMLDMVHLSHLAEREPYRLSGGEQQRVALARSLAPRPLALLLDEPFSNLDPHLRIELRMELQDLLHSTNVAAVHVTHDQFEAFFMGDRIVVMNAGKVEQVGTPEELFHHPQTRFVGQFLGIADLIPARATQEGLVTEIGVLRSETSVVAGAEVEVMLRGDSVTVRASEAGQGKVVNRSFRGTDYLYGVVLPSGHIIYSLQHNTVRLQPGDSVEVYLEPNQSLTCFTQNGAGPDKSGPFTAKTGPLT